MLLDSLNKFNTLNEKWHIFGHMNINVYETGTIYREMKKRNIIKGTNKISSKQEKYLDFCKTFGFKQNIKRPTRVSH